MMTAKPHLRLGVNIDHVATLRNARGGVHPSPVFAAEIAAGAGADGITAHLREDRRHIREADLHGIKASVNLPLNMEMAASAEMRDIALAVMPHAVCLVPENRQEITTEGGLDVAGQGRRLKPLMDALKDAGIRLSLFVEADAHHINAAADLGADIVELHAGAYSIAEAQAQEQAQEQAQDVEYRRLLAGAELAARLNLECHAGHGLDFANVGRVAAIPQVVELNIGHYLMGAAIETGLAAAIKTMRQRMDEARA